MKVLKKVLAILFAATMLTLSVTVSAVANDIPSYPYDDIDELNPEDFVQANAELMQIGRMAQMRRSSKSLTVVHYYQSNQTWSSDIMQNAGVTIGSQGCTLTSFAMIERYLGGNDDPGQVNTKMGNSACDKKNGFSYTVAASKYDFTISNYLRDDSEIEISSARDFIIGGIDSDYPVLVGLKTSSGNTHFVTAYGYNGTTIYIHDPAYYTDHTLLSDYLDKGYKVHRLYLYVE